MIHLSGRLLSLFVLMPIFTACQSTYQNSAQYQAQYLQQFIGQSAVVVHSTFSLDDLNYRATQPPRWSGNKLIYTYSRPLAIPITGQTTSSVGTVPIPVRMEQTVYDHSIQCQIIFYFAAQVATDVSVQGTGC